MSALQSILDSTLQSFKDVKKSGNVTQVDVLKIATNLLKSLYTMETLTTDEKKAFVFMSLQRGLNEVGRLQELSCVDPGIVSEVEKQILHIVVNAVFGLGDAFPQVFAEIKGIVSSVRRFLSKYIPACSEAAAVASSLDPKDGVLIVEAVAALKLLTTPAPLQIQSVKSAQEPVVPAAAVASAVDAKDETVIVEEVALPKLVATPAPLEIRTVKSTQESVVPTVAPEKLD